MTERTDFCTNETKKLLIASLESDDGVLVALTLRLNLHLCRELEEDGVRISERELNEVALVTHTITHTNELKRLLVALAHTNNHVVDQRAVKAVERLLLLDVSLVCLVNTELYLTILDDDLDGRIYPL